MSLVGDWIFARLALGLSRNGRTPSARREMIEYLISRTMGNQRRHTASLLAVQSPPAVRPSVCLSYMQPVGIQGRRAPPVPSRAARFASASSSSPSRTRSERSLVYELKARNYVYRVISFVPESVDLESVAMARTTALSDVVVVINRPIDRSVKASNTSRKENCWVPIM